jgi:Domain of unknown function (DUF4263)
MAFEVRTAVRDDNTLPMQEPYVDCGSASMAAVQELEALLNDYPDELEVQAFLSQHPWTLATWAGPGPVRWVFSHTKLGVEYVTDFLAADWRSSGISWTAIELESPKAKLLTKNGDFTSRANHAIRQIQDWRTWLGRNIDYASRPKDKDGLGLIDIDSRIRGVVFIGRRTEEDEKANARRRQLAADLGISLHSFDSLVDSARQEAERGVHS